MSNLIQFRADPELLRQFQEYIDKVEAETPPGTPRERMTKSKAARSLIQAALGTPPAVAAAQESVYLLAGLQKRVVNELTKLMQSRIEELLAEELLVDPVVD